MDIIITVVRNEGNESHARGKTPAVEPTQHLHFLEIWEEP